MHPLEVREHLMAMPKASDSVTSMACYKCLKKMKCLISSSLSKRARWRTYVCQNQECNKPVEWVETLEIPIDPACPPIKYRRAIINKRKHMWALLKKHTA